jgi:hypothetical protein
MDNIEFLRHVLGNEGYYCILGLKADSPPIQKLYPTIEAATSAAINLSAENWDAYFGLASFNDPRSRRADNVKLKQAFYLDVDCGVSKNGEVKPYESQEQGLIALKTFCKTLGMPKPTLVSSGGGIHAYWVLTEPITREVWEPLAIKLKWLCDKHEFHIDPKVTQDPARVLRVPGTFNYNYAEPRLVSIVGCVQRTYTLDELKNVIGDPAPAPKAFIPRGEMDEVTKAILGSYTNRFQTIMMKTNKDAGCAQLKYIYEQQATMPEDMWRAGISIAKFCVDADIWVEKISSGHPNYTPEDTAYKLARIKGPYTCETFAKLGNDYKLDLCNGCLHKDLIKSPVTLGREVLEATEEDNIVEDAPENISQGKTQTYVIPKYPPPYFRGKDGGVFKHESKPSNDDEDAVKDILIYHNDIYATRRLMDAELGESIVVRLHLPKDGVREFTVPLTSMTSKDELRKEMSKRGVALVKMDQVMQYMTTWVHTMQYQGKADIARRQFGWTNDKFESFVIGDKEVCADRIDHNPPSSATKELFEAFEPKGTLENWKEAMGFWNRPGMELHQFVIGAAFGSIFMKFTPINGVTIHVYSPNSGVGKSTSMKAGTSIWGNPARLIVKGVDTKNSKMNRVEVLNNIPFTMDEFTNASGMECSNFVYDMSSAEQKNRMTASSNQERHRGEPGNLLAISNGNSSLLEKMSTVKMLPQGEAMRVIDIRAFAVPGLEKKDTDELSTVIMNNYGHAGIVFLQYVLANIDEVRSMFKDIQQKMDVKCGFTSADRFHSAAVASAMAGLYFAKKAGLIEYTLKPITEWVVKLMASVKNNTEELDVDAESTITQYIAENWNNILLIRSTDDGRTRDGLDHLVIPDASPKFQYVIRYEHDTKMMFFYTPQLKEWCVKRQINYEGLLDALKQGRTRAKIELKRMAKGTKMNIPAARVLSIICKDFMTDDFEQQLKAESEHKATQEGNEEGANMS